MSQPPSFHQPPMPDRPPVGGGQPPFGQPGPYGHPGYHQPPQPKKGWFARHKIITGLLAVVALIVVISIATSASGGSDPHAAGQPQASTIADQGSESTDNKAEKKPASKAEPSHGIGDPTRAGDFQITVTAVECGKKRVGDQYFGETAQGQYCIASVKIKNVGDDRQAIDDSDFSLYDAKNRKFDVDGEAMISNGDSSDIWLEDINPGNTATGDVIFDLPKKDKPTKLVLASSDLFGEPAEIQLGS